MLSGTLFAELSNALGKKEIKQKKETVFSMGFLNTFFVVLTFLVIALILPEKFVFSSASLPTLIPRILLEITQMTFLMFAISKAPRSSFGFLRVLTIPLLLIADITLGYDISQMQLIAIGIIVTTLLFLFLNHGIKKKGSVFVLFTACNAVLTISLYKYNITYYNSVIAEQLIALSCVLLYFFISARLYTKENPLRLLKKRLFLFQSVSSGVAHILESFAYLFAPASVIIAAKRSSTIMWSIISGRVYFHEKHVLRKFLGFVVIAGALFLLAL